MQKKYYYFAVILLVAFLACLVVGCSSSQQTVKEQPKAEKQVADKKGILVVSFGTSYPDTRKVTIEACETKIAESYPEFEVRRAFTSNIIRKILLDRDKIEVDSVEEALTKMKDEGFSEVIVQPLHVIPGEEYNEKIVETSKEYEKDFAKLVVGRPILYGNDDYNVAVEAIKTQLPELQKDQAVVFMGHGTHHPANASYSMLQLKLWETMPNVLVGTVEGYPELDNVIEALKAKGIKEVTLMPFMIVAGDHANNDMAGDEEDSWKTILKKEGFIVNTVLKGLGENPGIQDIYVKHVQDCIDGNPFGHEE